MCTIPTVIDFFKLKRKKKTRRNNHTHKHHSLFSGLQLGQQRPDCSSFATVSLFLNWHNILLKCYWVPFHATIVLLSSLAHSSVIFLSCLSAYCCCNSRTREVTLCYLNSSPTLHPPTQKEHSCTHIKNTFTLAI